MVSSRLPSSRTGLPSGSSFGQSRSARDWLTIVTRSAAARRRRRRNAREDRNVHRFEVAPADNIAAHAEGVAIIGSMARPSVLTTVERAPPLRTVMRAALAATTPGRASTRDNSCWYTANPHRARAHHLQSSRASRD